MAEALVSARSSLRHNHVPHLLFASPLPEGFKGEPGLSVEPFEPSEHGYVDKIANMRRSPFERTIFLDTDTYVVGEILHVLRLLDNYELAVTHAPAYRGLHDPEVPAAFYELNSGMIAWRASERTTAFMSSWQETFEAWRREEPFRSAASGDQPAMRRVAWQQRLELVVLGPEYNYRTIVPQTVVDRVRVIHGRYGDFEALAARLNARRGVRTFHPQELTTGSFGGPQTPTQPTKLPSFVSEITQVQPDGQRRVFIGGPARSGTTALTFLLNRDPQIVLGVERFKRIMSWVDPTHFETDIFCNPIAAETDVLVEAYYGRLRTKLEAGGVRWIGDKDPNYVRHLAGIGSRFPDAQFIVTFREPAAVAASFQRRASDPDDRVWPAQRDAQASVAEYNAVLRQVRDFGDAGNRERLFILPYESFFGGQEIWLEALFAFLDLPLPASVRAAYRVMVAEAQARGKDASELDPATLTEIEANVDEEALKWWRGRLDEELAGVLATGGVTDSPVEVDALEGPELEKWRGEREEILAAMSNGAATAADRVPALRRRLEQVGGALKERTDRLLEREHELQVEAARRSTAEAAAARAASVEPEHGAAARSRAGSGRLRLTFVLPHQRRTTGGIYAMQQYARCLRSSVDVHLAVQETTPTPLRGTRAGWAIDVDDLPDADVLVMPAETPDEWLLSAPERKGRRVLYLQGFTTPGSVQTPTNLERFGDSATPTVVDADPNPTVIAVSRWLAAEAAQFGCRVAHVPYGLDRAVFSRGRDTTKRGPLVAMMTHEAEWKGADDGLRVVAQVRAERPDVELLLFGTGLVDIPSEFHDAPGRADVAKLLQRACVYIVPSWEEGYGMTGLEALACGAALATTDTKGSRDYAEDGVTALVSPPRDPAALAKSVLRLLDDGGLRSRLLAGASEMLAQRVPTWEESAARFIAAVADATAEPA